MEPLTPEQLRELKEELQRREMQVREEIRQELINSDDENYTELAGRVHDSGEESVADLLADLNISRVDRQVRQLREIDRALQRVRTGTYGQCEMCGNEIGYARLRSYPTAVRCIECQTIFEQTYAHEETPRL